MRKLFYFLILTMFFACTKTEVISEKTDYEENTQLENSDISGVWTYISDDEYFISFTEGGKYTFCLNKHLMGSGTYIIKNNTISLNNSYSNKSDKITIYITNDLLDITGDIFLFNSKQQESIRMQFIKSNETVSPSQVGVEHQPQLYGLNQFYDITYIGVKYITDTVVKYEYRGIHKTTKKEKVIKSNSWYYVYREPYTYTQEIGGDGTVIKYDFNNGSPKLIE